MTTTGPWAALAQEQALLSSIERRGEGWVSDGRLPSDDTTADFSASQSNDNARREDEVAELARTFTQASITNKDGQYVNPFLGSEDPLLDPNSGKFSARAWVKTLVGIQSRDPERYPERTSGVSYR
jgi:hypothetical protein